MREDGCGLGCGMMLLAVGAVLLCLFLPFIGLPLGMIIVTAVIVGAWVSGRKKSEGEGEGG